MSGNFAPGAGPGTNTGHGHVWARPDGVKARCGGPAMCLDCSRDRARWQPEPATSTGGLAGAGDNWMVIRKRDTDPVEVWRFEDEAEARSFHDLAQANWTDCYLLRVVKVGAQPDRDADLRALAAAVYQMAGVAGAPVRFLDALSAAASGQPFNVDDLLPVTRDEFGD